jgi:hypothetical protein
LDLTHLCLHCLLLLIFCSLTKSFRYCELIWYPSYILLNKTPVWLTWLLLDTNWGWNGDYRAKTRAQTQGDFTKNSTIISLNWWCNCGGAANLAIIIIDTRLQLRLCYRVLNGVTGYYYRSVATTNSLDFLSFFQVWKSVFALEYIDMFLLGQMRGLWSSLANRHGLVYECQLCLQTRGERERELSPTKNNHSS